MELASLIVACATIASLAWQTSGLPYPVQHNYHGRPRHERCPAVSEAQILCPQHARSCSLIKLDGCNRDGMYCCEDKCNNAICYDRHGTALHADFYRSYDARPYSGNSVASGQYATR